MFIGAVVGYQAEVVSLDHKIYNGTLVYTGYIDYTSRTQYATHPGGLAMEEVAVTKGQQYAVLLQERAAIGSHRTPSSFEEVSYCYSESVQGSSALASLQCVFTTRLETRLSSC